MTDFTKTDHITNQSITDDRLRKLEKTDTPEEIWAYQNGPVVGWVDYEPDKDSKRSMSTKYIRADLVKADNQEP